MKKKIVLSLIAIVAATSISAFADINIKVNGENVPFDANDNYGIPFVDENSRTLVPFRKTLEFAGATVDWIADSKTAVAKKDGIEVKVPIGEKYIYIDGELEIIDTQAIIKDGRTYLPIRAVLEALNYEIGWDQATQTVVAQTSNYVEPVVEPVVEKSIEELTNTSSAAEIEDFHGQENKVEFSIFIDVTEPLENQYNEVQNYLDVKVGEALSLQIIQYVQLKTSWKEKLEDKDFVWENKTVFVGSESYEGLITIRGN